MNAFADPVRIRPLVGGERQPVLDVFAGLSEQSRRRRFLGPKPALREQEVESLVDVGCCGRQAVVATDPASGASVGIARFVRDGERDTAEVAFEVVDAWQGRGVGSRLAAALSALARDEGLRHLHATIAPGNQAAMAMMRRLGHVEWAAFVDGAYEVVVAL